jgi:hypothetical protein
LCAEIGLCSAGSPHGNSSPFINPQPNATTANDKSDQIVLRNKVNDSQRCRFQRRWSFSKQHTLIILHVMMLPKPSPIKRAARANARLAMANAVIQDRPGAIITPMEKPGQNNQNCPTTRVFDGLHWLAPRYNAPQHSSPTYTGHAAPRVRRPKSQSALRTVDLITHDMIHSFIHSLYPSTRSASTTRLVFNQQHLFWLASRFKIGLLMEDPGPSFDVVPTKGIRAGSYSILVRTAAVRYQRETVDKVADSFLALRSRVE